MSDKKKHEDGPNILTDGAEDDDGRPERTRVDSHEIDVYYDTGPDPDDNYGRERYTVTVTYDKETGDPSFLYAVEHRWKGNYWRDMTDWDWRDLPAPVRRCVAAVLPVESPDELDRGVRLMDEGGESRWKKHHKHRVESLSGDEMWGTSFLRDALDDAETAAESFDGGSEGEERAENVVSAIQEAIEAVEEDDAE
jgi:hypothetical protein